MSVSEYVSEQEILSLLKKLEREAPAPQANPSGDHYSAAGKAVNRLNRTDGCVKVEEGKVIVANPTNGGEIPTIRANEPIVLHVDGELVASAAEVSSESVITWQIEELPLYAVTVSEDKLEAYLTVYRSARYAWTLVDSAPTTNAVLKAEEDAAIKLEVIDLQDILATIESMNIKSNLDVAAIQLETARPSGQPVAIARGKAPIQGEDARLTLNFSEKIESAFHEIGGVVDYKNHLQIPSVKSGDVIAMKSQPVPGQPGYDVYGNVILPDPVQDVRIAGKDNVKIIDDSVVVALKEGRPRMTGNRIKYFDINTTHVITGNVDLSTGNIVFAGDVIVYGDVTDNMIIESLGNIYVNGSVFNATLTATGSIAVKGHVAGSNLYSGYFGMLYNRLYHNSKHLIEIVEKMAESARMLLAETDRRNRQVNYGQVLVLLSESKYTQAGEIVKELLGVISSIQSYDKNALHPLQHYLQVFLQPTRMIEVMSPHRMMDFLRVLKDAFMRVALSQESNVRIVINQSHRSTLKSNGDILIRKEGVIQCDLYSANNIVFYLDNSVCRGSKLEAGDTISAMIVGGVSGARTSLKAINKVVVKKMYEGRVMIDRYSIDLFEPVEDQTFDLRSMNKRIREPRAWTAQADGA